ncbi:hypothetical protein ATK36_0909 [Amycolatopsis sulphurea]|uniref:Uncharacterized protein n=1 Tax=Amycolatopsis sulphurea TaxID=76022 RepID=A0A2A9G367_9PSEU|nr:hypothetical protein [Amycolatopsis sulphurea]PFG57331.1 hypothetical protein ATK36_0909 [Amycolatopsis sulphurea]
MTSSGPVIVPVRVEAMQVNLGSATNDSFLRWDMSFDSMLTERQSPEPRPGEGLHSITKENFPKTGGVYLHWQLPEALCHGVQRSADAGKGLPERVEFPTVPNRWLVVRYHRPVGDSATPSMSSWLVESDYLDEYEGTSPYLDPDSGEATLVGQLHELTATKGVPPLQGRKPHLTAIGPQVPGFAAYQPYNQNVFSLHDQLKQREGTGKPVDIAEAMVSYVVIGWHSAQDILAVTGTDLPAALAELEWQLDDPVGLERRALYVGSVLGLHWKRTGDRPQSRIPGIHDPIDVSVGANSADAVTAMVLGKTGKPELTSLLEAFMYGLLDSVAELRGHLVKSAGGSAALRMATHRNWFSQAGGGYTWEVSDKTAPPDKPWPPLTPKEQAAEDAWLNTLNAAQQRVDVATRELLRDQQRLHDLWWLRGVGGSSRPADFDTWCDVQLDPAREGLAKSVNQQLDRLRGSGGLRPKVPWGDTEAELRTSIDNFQAKAYERGDLVRHRVITRAARQPFQRPVDPVVMLCGVRGEEPVSFPDRLPCRRVPQLISKVVTGSEVIVPASPVVAPKLEGLPDPATLTAVLREFSVLEQVTVRPGGLLEDVIAKAAGVTVTGQVPAFLTRWQQPWSPTYLVWHIKAQPAPYYSPGQYHWKYDPDRDRYSWQGVKPTEPDLDIKGRSYLANVPTFNLRARIDQYVKAHPHAPIDELAKLRDMVAGWDLLSLSMDGVNEWFTRHLPAGNLVPGDQLGQVLAGQAYASVPDLETPDSRRFQPARAGQFYFYGLAVADRFGRAAEVVNSTNYLRKAVWRAERMTPDKSMGDARYLELPPRLDRGARLRFEFVGTADASPLSGDAPAAAGTPVAGWLMVNHFSQSLLVYAPDGSGLGELRVVLHGTDRVIEWSRLPDSPYDSLENPAFQRALPHLQRFLSSLRNRGARCFEAFRKSVDGALQRINPPPGAEERNLALLVGRPVALLRARVRLEQDGIPAAEPTWAEVRKPAPPLPSQRWNVRLGAHALSTDGLIGYFGRTDGLLDKPAPEDIDYQAMFAVNPLRPVEDPDRYLKPITAADLALPSTVGEEDLAGTAYLSLLVDPRAEVYAVSDILPAVTLRLPPRLLTDALHRLRPAFRMDPLLAAARTIPSTVPGTPPTTAIAVPQPTAWRGTWRWSEPTEATKWQTWDITPADPSATLPGPVPHARSGYLLFDAASDNNGKEATSS